MVGISIITCAYMSIMYRMDQLHTLMVQIPAPFSFLMSATFYSERMIALCELQPRIPISDR